MASLKSLTLSSGIQITFDPNSVVAVASDEQRTGSLVYGPTRASVAISESPEAFLYRLGIEQQFVRLTRPNGSPFWIKPGSVSSLRPTLPGEFHSRAHTVIVAGSLTQAVEEVPEVVQATLNAPGQGSHDAQSAPEADNAQLNSGRWRTWLPRWVWNAEARDVAKFIAGGIAAVVIAGWTVFAFFIGHEPSHPDTKATDITFLKSYRLCRASDGALCMPESEIIGCAIDYGDWAKHHCEGKYDITHVYHRPGGVCGYDVVTITCAAK